MHDNGLRARDHRPYNGLQQGTTDHTTDSNRVPPYNGLQQGTTDHTTDPNRVPSTIQRAPTGYHRPHNGPQQGGAVPQNGKTADSLLQVGYTQGHRLGEEVQVDDELQGHGDDEGHVEDGGVGPTGTQVLQGLQCHATATTVCEQQ